MASFSAMTRLLDPVYGKMARQGPDKGVVPAGGGGIHDVREGDGGRRFSSLARATACVRFAADSLL
jgi:hypothetical protein